MMITMNYYISVDDIQYFLSRKKELPNLITSNPTREFDFCLQEKSHRIVLQIMI